MVLELPSAIGVMLEQGRWKSDFNSWFGWPCFLPFRPRFCGSWTRTSNQVRGFHFQWWSPFLLWLRKCPWRWINDWLGSRRLCLETLPIVFLEQRSRSHVWQLRHRPNNFKRDGEVSYLKDLPCAGCGTEITYYFPDKPTAHYCYCEFRHEIGEQIAREIEAECKQGGAMWLLWCWSARLLQFSQSPDFGSSDTNAMRILRY